MGLTLPVIIEDPLLRETEFGRADWFSLRVKHTGGDGWRHSRRSFFDRSISGFTARVFGSWRSGLRCCGDSFGSQARFGASRCVAGFKGADPSKHWEFSVELRCELSSSLAFAFGCFGQGLNFSRIGSDFVSLPAAVQSRRCRRLSRLCSRLFWLELDSAVFWPERFIACPLDRNYFRSCCLRQRFLSFFRIYFFRVN